MRTDEKASIKARQSQATVEATLETLATFATSPSKESGRLASRKMGIGDDDDDDDDYYREFKESDVRSGIRCRLSVSLTENGTGRTTNKSDEDEYQKKESNGRSGVRYRSSVSLTENGTGRTPKESDDDDYREERTDRSAVTFRSSVGTGGTTKKSLTTTTAGYE